MKPISNLKNDSQLFTLLKAAGLLIALLAMLLAGSGCGSLGARLDHSLHGSGNLGVYPGVREDVKFVAKSPVQAFKEPLVIPFVPLIIVDIPLSFVLDTALLPSDLKEK
jgi:uncharacterized protein YceK